MNQINLSLQALKNAYQQGELYPRSLMSQLRAQALAQSEYNAWITLLDEAQLEPYLSRLDSESVDSLPLYGVPFAVKDNIDLAGIETTAGCPDFAYTPEKSAPVVAALIAAGAIPLGKTNLDQFATGLVGTRSPYGEGKNSFNPDYISGGSSAGSAIATALGQVSFALGTDTAGSGRVPAALNNLIGHKPSKGLLSTLGVVPACRSLDCVSIFSLCSRDAAILLDITAKYDSEDPFARPNHYANRSRYFSATATQPSFRFAVPSQLEFCGNAETQTLFEQSVAQLCELGGEKVEIDFSPFLAAAKLLYEGPWVCERWLATQEVNPDSMEPIIAEIIDQAVTKTGNEAFAAQYRLAELKRQCDKVIENFDFVLTPTMPTIFTRSEIAENPIVNNSILGTYTNFMNLLDYCATALPVGFTASGVPWGVTLFGPAFSDIKLLGFADRLHRACNLTLGAMEYSLSDIPLQAGMPAPSSQIAVVVCGAHLQGQPLNWQLTERGGVLVEKTVSAAAYELYALSDGIRPGMVRNEDKGQAIEVEVWSLPADTFGSFVTGIPAPLGIGKVEMSDGRWVSGFICDGYGLAGATDVSRFGGWRAWLSYKASL